MFHIFIFTLRYNPYIMNISVDTKPSDAKAKHGAFRKRIDVDRAFNNSLLMVSEIMRMPSALISFELYACTSTSLVRCRKPGVESVSLHLSSAV